MYTDVEKVVMPLTLCILLIITFLLWLLLRNKGEAVQGIPFKIIALILLIGEVVKQIISIRQGYNLWHLPLHFCSTYFIWFSIAEFSKGELHLSMRNMSFVATFYLCAAMYSYPGSIVPHCDNIFKDYFSAHSFFFHHLVILYLLLTIAFKRYKPQKKDALVWVGCFTIYYALAFICAHTFEKNFFNILHSGPLTFIEPIRLKIGQVWYNIGLLFVLLFFGSSILYVSAVIRQRRLRKKEWIEMYLAGEVKATPLQGHFTATKKTYTLAKKTQESTFEGDFEDF